MQEAVVAEWLRRLTINQIPSGSAGSSPADRGKNFFQLFMKSDRFNLSLKPSSFLKFCTILCALFLSCLAVGKKHAALG